MQFLVQQLRSPSQVPIKKGPYLMVQVRVRSGPRCPIKSRVEIIALVQKHKAHTRRGAGGRYSKNQLSRKAKEIVATYRMQQNEDKSYISPNQKRIILFCFFMSYSVAMITQLCT